MSVSCTFEHHLRLSNPSSLWSSPVFGQTGQASSGGSAASWWGSRRHHLLPHYVKKTHMAMQTIIWDTSSTKRMNGYIHTRMGKISRRSQNSVEKVNANYRKLHLQYCTWLLDWFEESGWDNDSVLRQWFVLENRDRKICWVLVQSLSHWRPLT